MCRVLACRRCSELVTEADTACTGLIGQVQDRFGDVLGEAMQVGREKELSHSVRLHIKAKSVRLSNWNKSLSL